MGEDDSERDREKDRGQVDEALVDGEPARLFLRGFSLLRYGPPQLARRVVDDGEMQRPKLSGRRFQLLRVPIRIMARSKAASALRS